MQSKPIKAIILLALLAAIIAGAYLANAQEKAPETTPDRLVRISAATEQRFPAGVDPSGPANLNAVAVTTDMGEGFESSWPAAGWDIADLSSSDGGEYLFGKRNCHPRTGSYGGWSVGAGAQGSALDCSGDYPHNAETWAVYGPFDLTDATSASFTFHLWGRTQSSASCSLDYLFAGSSTDGINFSGGARYCGDGTGGTAGNGYHELNLDLSSRLGESQVWIAFVFVSDASDAYQGFTLDDISLTVSGAVATATPPESATHTPTATLPVPTPTGTTMPSGDSDNFLPVVLRDYPSGPAPTPTQTATSGPPAPTATPSPTATTPSIVPKDGEWSGTNDQGRSLSFSVASNGTSIPKFTLQVGWNGACGGVSYTESYFYDIGINNLSFSKTSGSNKITGSFSGAATASGTYDAVLETYYPYYCKVTRSGTWTATTP